MTCFGWRRGAVRGLFRGGSGRSLSRPGPKDFRKALQARPPSIESVSSRKGAQTMKKWSGLVMERRTGSTPLAWGVEDRIEGRVEHHRPDSDNEHQEDDRVEANGHPLGLQLEGPDEQGGKEESGEGRQVPTVQEAQAPQRQHYCQDFGRPPPQPAQGRRGPGAHDVVTEGDCHDDERQGHDMRMKVAEEEAEEGELGDGEVDPGVSHKGVDDPGGAEPPPELGGVPRGAGRVRRDAGDTDPNQRTSVIRSRWPSGIPGGQPGCR